MLRKDKEITHRDEIEAIIRQASGCRLAMVDDNRPCLVPLCLGFEDDTPLARTVVFKVEIQEMTGKKAG